MDDACFVILIVGAKSLYRGETRLRVMMIGPTGKSGGVATHTKELTNALRKLGIDVNIYNINPSKNRSTPISTFVKLYKRTFGLLFKLLKNRKKIDVVHVQASGPLGGFLPAITAAILRNLVRFNFIVTFHYSNTKFFVKKYPTLFKYVLKRTSKFIVVSEAQKNAITNTLVNKFQNKLKVIPNGYNPGKFKIIPRSDARKRLGISSDSKVLVNVALLLPKKGQKYLIDTLNILINEKNMKNIKCFIIGPGPLYEKLQSQISSLNLDKNVRLCGWVSLEKLYLYLNAADIFVLPSLKEGNPTVMFEALGVGLPFVGTAVGGVPEIITSGDYGLLCPPADHDCLAEKILEALNKEWDTGKIREYAKQFTWENIAKKVIKVYQEALSKQ